MKKSEKRSGVRFVLGTAKDCVVTHVEDGFVIAKTEQGELVQALPALPDNVRGTEGKVIEHNGKKIFLTRPF